MKGLITILELLRLSVKMMELKTLSFIETQKEKLNTLIQKSLILIFLMILASLFIGFAIIGIFYGLFLILSIYTSKITAVFILSFILLLLGAILGVYIHKKIKEIKEIL
ncbi:hypothetical protein [Caminibacter pacificus]